MRDHDEDRRGDAPPRFVRDERGATAITWAGLMMVALAAVGFGIDAAMMFEARQRLWQAADAAALAMGKRPSSEGQDAIKAKGADVFAANAHATDSFIPGGIDTDFSGNTINVTANASFKPLFSAAFGFNSVTLSAFSQVTRKVSGLEVSLVLDVTGSMFTNDNIDALKAAANGVSDELFGGLSPHPLLRVAIVPWVTAVNAGVTLSDGQVLANKLIDTSLTKVTPDRHDGSASKYVEYSATPNEVSTSDTTVPIYWRPTNTAKTAPGWAGCVIERSTTNDRDIDDSDVATGGYWTQFYWKDGSDNNWRGSCSGSGSNYQCNKTIQRSGLDSTSEKGPNLACPSPMLPLTNDKAKVTEAINKLTGWRRGGTVGTPGLAWGLRLISPNSTYLPEEERGKAWNTVGWEKAVVFMTDGDTNVQNNDLTGYGYPSEERMGGSSSASSQESWVNDRIATLCTAIKAKGVTVFTIVFTSNINTTTKNVYRTCASDSSKFFDAPSQDDLKLAFENVGRQLSSLRISK